MIQLNLCTKFIFFQVFREKKLRLKFHVSKYLLRWDSENMASSIMFPKKIHNYRFTSTLRLEIINSLLSGDDSLN